MLINALIQKPYWQHFPETRWSNVCLVIYCAVDSYM